MLSIGSDRQGHDFGFVRDGNFGIVLLFSNSRSKQLIYLSYKSKTVVMQAALRRAESLRLKVILVSASRFV
jgi:hypothetical protein